MQLSGRHLAGSAALLGGAAGAWWVHRNRHRFRRQAAALPPDAKPLPPPGDPERAPTLRAAALIAWEPEHVLLADVAGGLEPLPAAIYEAADQYAAGTRPPQADATLPPGAHRLLTLYGQAVDDVIGPDAGVAAIAAWRIVGGPSQVFIDAGRRAAQRIPAEAFLAGLGDVTRAEARDLPNLEDILPWNPDSDIEPRRFRREVIDGTAWVIAYNARGAAVASNRLEILLGREGNGDAVLALGTNIQLDFVDADAARRAEAFKGDVSLADWNALPSVWADAGFDARLGAIRTIRTSIHDAGRQVIEQVNAVWLFDRQGRPFAASRTRALGNRNRSTFDRATGAIKRWIEDGVSIVMHPLDTAVWLAQKAVDVATAPIDLAWRVGRYTYGLAANPGRTFNAIGSRISALPSNVRTIAARAYEVTKAIVTGEYAEEIIRMVLRCVVKPLVNGLIQIVSLFREGAIAIGIAAVVARLANGLPNKARGLQYQLLAGRVAVRGAESITGRLIGNLPAPPNVGPVKAGDFYRSHVEGPLQKTIATALGAGVVLVASGRAEEIAAIIAGVGILSWASGLISQGLNLAISQGITVASSFALRGREDQVSGLLTGIGVPSGDAHAITSVFTSASPV